MAALAVLGLESLAVARGSATAGTVVALFVLAPRLLLPLRQLLASAGGWGQIATQVRILQEALAVPADPRLAQGAAAAADPPGRVAGPLSLRGVSFGYAPRQPPLLHDVDLDVAPAEQLGIVAPSAGGNSTLAGLLVGLHRPWAGRVELAGRPLDELPPAVLARSVGWVPKAPLLFEGTVRENLSLWDPSIGEEALRAAVRDAELSDVLAQRAGGLDSPVDHRGRNLCGGQRLRLELARVLVRDPALIVVDEAFDVLELPLEEAIRANLRRRGCALVLISQRAESLRSCDRTVVLEQGTVVAENGSAVAAVAAGFQPADAPRQVENSPPQEPDDIAPIDPWARPCRGLAAAFRAAAAAVGEMVEVSDDAAETVPQLAQVTGLRVRRVRFRRGDWWRDDHGPLLALRDDDTAVALLPQASGYVCFDPAAGSRRRLTAADAVRLVRTAFMIYDRSWQQVRRPWDLLRQAALAARGDLALVVLTALAAALLTAVAPLAGASLVVHWRTAVLAGIALAAAGLLLCDAIGTAAPALPGPRGARRVRGAVGAGHSAAGLFPATPWSRRPGATVRMPG